MNHCCTCITDVHIRDKHFALDIQINNGENMVYHKPTFDLLYAKGTKTTYSAAVGELKPGKTYLYEHV